MANVGKALLLQELRGASSRSTLATMLGANPRYFTYDLYVKKITNDYSEFSINKRSGGERKINSPSEELKLIQAKLASLLLDCLDSINELGERKYSVSHGFERKRSIITNAEKHKNQKVVLNLDIKNFFDSFNFGRVYFFFKKNRDFNLSDEVAKTIAHIACYKGKLPQGSPCSPVITNLITRSLDMRLVSIAKKFNCVYSRYADDITFSTRKKSFPEEILTVIDNKPKLGFRLVDEIKRAGFEINNDKVRVQYKDSRQDVTGLIVNKKVNIKSEYWRNVRGMCHNLFKTGTFYIRENGREREGNMNELAGMLSFIDSVDKYNNLKPSQEHKFQIKSHGLDYQKKLNVREKTYSKFLFYTSFIANKKPLLICEGKTDNVYIKCALDMLKNHKFFPLKEYIDSGFDYFNYSKKTRYLMDLYGGASYLKRFIERYDVHSKIFTVEPSHPVLILLDNDRGNSQLFSFFGKRMSKSSEEIRNSKFIHLRNNVYVIFTPLNGEENTYIEKFFHKSELNYVIDNKKFNPDLDSDSANCYGKHVFSIKVIKARKEEVRFEKFIPILESISLALDHFYKQGPQ